MMRFRILWILVLAVLLTGCIQPDEDHIEIDSYSVDLTESQNEVTEHLKTIIESQNRAITSFNNHEYAACLTECEQLKRQNEKYASSIESFADLVMEAPLSESDRTYYRVQLSILHAIHCNLNQSVSDLYSACEYAAEGEDEDARYHVRRAGKYINTLYVFSYTSHCHRLSFLGALKSQCEYRNQVLIPGTLWSGFVFSGKIPCAILKITDSLLRKMSYDDSYERYEYNNKR